MIVNYETTWYPSHAALWNLVKQRGEPARSARWSRWTGTRGRRRSASEPEFLDWLTDPVRNGAGALFDFGCYGANLMTWLMDNQRPLTVTAVTQRIKPDIYPRVDDEATILVEYPKAQGIIQASWNWPFGRKDLEVYGASGYAIATGGNVEGATAEKAERSGRPSRGPQPRATSCVFRGDREGHDDAVGPVVAREQPDRHRDPRRGARVGADGQDDSPGALTERRACRVQGPRSGARRYNARVHERYAVAIGVAFGLLLGVGGYTFLYARGASYLTNDPNACANCHVMSEQFEGWQHSSHRSVAVCNDCHAPHDFVGKYMTKARNGFWHSFYFTTGTFHEPHPDHAPQRAVTEGACRTCHAESSQAIDTLPRSRAGHSPA